MSKLSEDRDRARRANESEETRPFSLLSRLHHDDSMVQIFSERMTVNGWLAFERALAHSQADLGLTTRTAAAEIDRAARLANIDMDRLWEESQLVGYPILPLVRQIASHVDPASKANPHLGATTQDAMDCGAAVQIRDALDRLDELTVSVGDSLAEKIEIHSGTIMAARTHAQIAVPTTLGTKLAVFLGEFSRHRERIKQLRPRVCRVSLFGAGGTSAALGSKAPELRRMVAERLGLSNEPIPWHVSRDGLAEFAVVCALLAKSCVRLAREVIELSRPEIREVSEERGHHRGASSTMPQKDNPILAESVVGLGSATVSAAMTMFRSLEALHERAAGEWQGEWDSIPRSACLSAAALRTSCDLIRGLEVHPNHMAANLAIDGNSVMSEAYMMALAPTLGKEKAHDMVYEWVRRAREYGVSLEDVIRDDTAMADHPISIPIVYDSYLGETASICRSAIEMWKGQEFDTGSNE